VVEQASYLSAFSAHIKCFAIVLYQICNWIVSHLHPDQTSFITRRCLPAQQTDHDQ